MLKEINSDTAAKLLNISPRRVQQMCKNGELKDSKKVNKSWIIPFSSVEPFLNYKLDLPLPVGVSSYKNVVDNCYYVDKTLLIKNIIDENPNQVLLFTRPRRFGKTLTMDMLKTFFEYDPNNDNSKYFTDKLIYSEGEKYQAYQGKFPVIYLSFKDIKNNTWDDTLRQIKLIISNEFRRHNELETSNLLSKYEKEKYLSIASEQADKVEYEIAFKYLCDFLCKHYQQKCIIIIDEYDTPITTGYLNGYYNEVIVFMRNLLSSCLKDNNNLQYGFLTGILKIAKESIFSGLNNLIVSSIVDNKYSEYFGFTKEEVKTMLSCYGKAKKYQEVCDWYDGYRFGNQEIFNPWSVINYLANDCIPKHYWNQTSSNEIISELLLNSNDDVDQKLNDLLMNRTITTPINFDVIYPNLQDNSNDNNIFSFLLLTGYLKQESIYYDGNYDVICDLSIPNREVSTIYKKEIINKLGKNNIALEISQAIINKNIAGLKEYLEKYLIESVSVFDGVNESFYHGMMLGLCAMVSNSYHIKSNKESGYGRFDIELCPINKNNHGFIFELKYVKNEKDLEQASIQIQALKQIEEKKYDESMLNNNINNIIKVGIAFCGKKTHICNYI